MHMFVFRTGGFIYNKESLKLAKSFVKSVDYLDAVYLHDNYCIGEEFIVVC